MFAVKKLASNPALNAKVYPVIPMLISTRAVIIAEVSTA